MWGRKLIAFSALTGTALFASLAQAAPSGGQVSAGTGSITQTGATAQTGVTTTITQQSQNLAIDWNTFSIAANESVRFNQPNVSSIALNRILGPDPSQIFGNLSANGQVFILNPNGVLFGQGAQVNVGGLVASTLSLSNADFMAGKYTLSNGGSAGSVINQGNLTAADGGYIALLAPEVRNEGVITATLGTALLAAGDKVTLNLNNGSLLSYAIDQGALNALAENKQLIQADGGQVIMSARAANALTSSVVNNTGIIKARTIQNQGGTIRLLGDMQVGQVNVGGTLDASAPNGGDGGFIETSAHTVNLSNPTITASAPYGKGGTWLIDPTDVLMDAAYNAPIVTSLNAGTNVTVATVAAGAQLGNITVAANIAKTAGAAATLSLQAHNNIIVNSGVTISSTVGALNVFFISDADATGGGNIQMGALSGITTNGGNILMGGGMFFTGAVGSGTTGNNLYGVYLNGAALNAGVGYISLIGTGVAGTNYAYGIYVLGGSAITTTSGNITLTGTDTGGGGTNYNSGVVIGGSGTNITSATGAISIVGTGAGSGINNYGIYMYGGAAVTSTGSANITLDGRGAGAAQGIYTITGGNTIGGATDTGNITLIANTPTGADSIWLSDLTIQSTGNLLLQPLAAATTIGLAGGAGTFNLDSTELGFIQNGFANITIGRTNGTGAITTGTWTVPASANLTLQNPGASSAGIAINGALTLGAGKNLTLNTTGAVTQTAAITASGLELLGTGGTYTLTNTGNAITTLAGNTGTVSLVENSGFAIGTVNTIGLTTSGNITLSTTGAVTQTAAITAAGLELLGIGGAYTLTNAGNLITTLAGNTGSINLINNRTLTVGTVNTAGITTTGNLTLAATGTGTGTNAYGLYLNATSINAGAGNISLTGTGAAGTSSAYGIYALGGTTITTTSGTITLNGTGGAGTSYNIGVYLTGAGTNVSSATGAISITGTGAGTGIYNFGIAIAGGAAVNSTGSATISMLGTSGAGTNYNYGVYLTGASTNITSGTGATSITGAGAGTGTNNYGILMDSGAAVTSTGAATITMLGTGGAGTNNNSGVFLSATVTSSTGAISITGTGAGSGINNYGISMYGGAAVTSTGSANITLDGRGAGTAQGIYIYTSGVVNTIGGATNTGNITLIADTATGADSISLANLTISGTGNLLLQPLNAATAIGLAGGAGTFNLDSTELATISNGFANITIGRTNGTGAITTGAWTVPASANLTLQNSGVGSSGMAINGALTLGAGKNLTLNTRGAVTQTAAITAPGLELLGTGGAYTLTNAGNLITTLAGNTGSINLTNNQTLTVGTVNTTGITTTGNLTLTAIGTGTGTNAYGLYLNATSINAGAGNISLTGTGAAGTTSAYGIYALGGTTITTTSGNITLNGTGGAGTDSNYGVYLTGTGANVTSATGAISITGTGAGTGAYNLGILIASNSSVTSTGAATITLLGTGGPGINFNYGVYLTGAGTNVSSATGAISITGTGAGTGAYNLGILIDSNSSVTSTGTATITLVGTGGSGTSSNYGVYLSGTGTNVSSATGAISITGTGAGSGTGNYGIAMAWGAAVTSTGAATITLDGRGAGTAPGIYTISGANSIGGAADTGNITLIANTATGADSIFLSGLTIRSAGNLLLQPLNAATTIGIAGGAGTFNLDATELTMISNGFANITIGRTNGTGAITTGAWTVPVSANLTLQNPGAGSGGIAINGALTLGAGKNLTLNTTGTTIQTAAITAAGLELLGTGGAYTLTNTGNAITTIAGNTGTVSFTENSGFAIGTVNTVGLTTTGNTTLSTTGTVTQTAAITAAGLELLGAGGIFILTNTGNLITTLAGNTGTINLTNNQTLTVGTVNTVGITTTGNLTLAATGTGTGTNAYGLYLNATSINAGAGNISLTGTGAAGTSSAYGIYALGGTTITTTSGNITMLGTGGAGTDNNHGVYLTGAGTNVTSATGAISITGTGAGTGWYNFGIFINSNSSVTSTGTATITLIGTGGAGTSYNLGVYLADGNASAIGGNVTSASGAISITGQGSGTSAWNHGIFIDSNSSVTSTGLATITLLGTGGAGTITNYGVYLADGNSSGIGGNVTSASGVISITGTGGAGTGTENYGIVIDSNSSVTSTGNANITLDGRGAGTAAGIYAINGANSIGGATDTGNITLIASTATGADSIFLSGLTIRSAGNLLLQPLNAATTIGIAGGAGTFNLDATELATISNGFANITIGRTNGTGAITTGAWTVPASANLTLQNPGAGSSGMAINGALTLGVGKNLTLNTTGAVTQTSAITAAGLELLGAGGAYTLTTGNLITTLAGNTGTVNYSQPGSLTIGTVNTTGLTASNTILVQTTGAADVTLNNAVTANGTGDALILASGRNFINNAGAAPLSAPNGRYLVYSTDPAANTFGAFSSTGNYFNCVYGTCTPAASLGSRLVYSIAAPTLTITADPASRLYGAANPALTYATTGFIAGDTAATALTGSLSTAATPASNVGSYAITQGTLADLLGYTITYTGNNLTINPAALTIAIVGTPIKVYDGTNTATLTSANYSLSGFVAGEGATVGQTAGTYNSQNVLAANSVSTTLVSNNFSANGGTSLGNYILPTTATGAASITPAGLSPSADAATQMANRLLFSGTSGGTTNAGSYVITPSGLYSTFYNISFSYNTLTILPSPTQTNLTGGVYEIWYGVLSSDMPRLLVGL